MLQDALRSGRLKRKTQTLTDRRDNMAIYIIRSGDSADSYIADITSDADAITSWNDNKYRLRFAVEEQPDATANEMATVAAIDAWLLANYARGGHWIYETTDELHHVVALRGHGGDLDAYKADMRDHWELLNGVDADISNA
jgi:hypothetical protein